LLDGLPFGVVAEGFPVGGGGFAARVGDDVEESFAFERVVGGNPVSDVFDAVLFKELHGVFAETAENVVELAFEGVVDAEFVDGSGGFGGVGSSHGWKESGNGKRLKQCASVHTRDCNRGLRDVERRSTLSERFQNCCWRRAGRSSI
jgi:hypothetical protein